MNNGIFIGQLLGAVTAGAFIGEFQRTGDQDILFRKFISQFLSCAFVAYMAAYLLNVYVLRNDGVASAIGGLIAHRDEEFIRKVSSRMVEGAIRLWGRLP